MLFRSTVAQTLDKLVADGADLQNIITTLASDKDTKVTISNSDIDKRVANAGGGNINWNAQRGHVLVDDSKQSPAIALIHELGHSFFQSYKLIEKIALEPKLEDYTSIEEWAKAISEFDSYDYEENWVIEKVETPAAETYRQGTRKEHKFKDYFKAVSPFSIEEDNNKRIQINN